MYMSDKIKKFKNVVSQIISGKNLDNDDKSWNNSQELNNFIISSKQIEVFSLGLENIEQDFYIIKVMRDISNKDIVKTINDYLETNPIKFKEVNFLWIVNNLKNKLQLNIELKNIIKQVKQECKAKARIVSTLFIFKETKKEGIELKDIKRYELLTMPPMEIDYHVNRESQEKKDFPFKGYVFSAKLFNLVNIYNEVGDELFKHNLRHGIGEQLGVDEAIKDTLKEQPDYFWFRNNGVTIILEEPVQILEKTNSILLKPTGSENIAFSVVNGAQTINAAAQFYYTSQVMIDKKEQEKKDEKDENKIKELELEIVSLRNKLESAKEAKVILRIIQFQKEADYREVKKMSVALNRQKPIREEDIAYTNFFIDKMNQYLLDNNKGISLCKRSENSFLENEISVIDFARARKAISGDPGKARSAASNYLLKTKEEKFVDKSIFVNDWYAYDEKNSDKIFQKYYSPVKFAIKLANMYEDTYRKILSENNLIELLNEPSVDSIKTVIENGKWYFVSYVVYILNKNNDENYTNFAFEVKNIENKLKELIIAFAKDYIEYIKKEGYKEKIDSNMFKNNSKYNKLKSVDNSSFLLYKQLKEIYFNEKLEETNTKEAMKIAITANTNDNEMDEARAN